MAQTALSGNNKIDSLLSTYQWGNSNGNSISLSYSFPVSSSTWVSPYGTSNEPFSPYLLSYLNSVQQSDVTTILQQWSDVANISFSQVSEPNIQGDIRIAYTSLIEQLGYAGWAYYPSNSGSLPSDGDIWLGSSYSDFSYAAVSGYSVVMHEVGHALGLKHSFESDAQNNTTILPSAEDNNQYTLMSYNAYDKAGYTQISGSNSYQVTAARTPMLYDIAAIQFLYGANTSYNSGNDAYSFSNSSAQLMTIWDAGGIDSFDLSNQSMAVQINLNAGSYSSIGIKYVLDANGFIQTTAVAAEANVAIAYNVEIENAIGGSGNDTLIGNALANELSGGAGDDSIDGGSGEDTAVYSGNRADYQITTLGAGLQISSASEGIDSLLAIEKLQFADLLLDASTLLAINTSVSPPTIPAEVDTTPTEGSVNHSNYFLLQIGKALSVDASVNYITQDGTAIAGLDYVFTSGTATIPAGQTSTVIAVEIIADSIAESDETFLLAISNPQGGIFPTGVSEITASRTIIDDDNVPAASLITDEIQLVAVDTSLPA